MSDRMCSLAICVIGLARGFAVHLQVTFLNSPFVFIHLEGTQRIHRFTILKTNLDVIIEQLLCSNGVSQKQTREHVFFGFILVCVKAYKTLIAQLPPQWKISSKLFQGKDILVWSFMFLNLPNILCNIVLTFQRFKIKLAFNLFSIYKQNVFNVQLIHLCA